MAALSILVVSATFAQKGSKAAPTSSDSLSYAVGVMMTQGLDEYLQKQKNITPELMKFFIQGFNEATAKKDDPKTRARMTGWQIADDLKARMVPQAKREFTDTPDSINTDYLYKGFIEAVAGKTTMIEKDKAEKFFSEKQQYNKTAKEEKLTKAGREFLAENAKKPGVITTESGLQYKIIEKGTGEVPQKTDKVQVHYEGRLIDGTVFDASRKHGNDPLTFQPSQVIKGWQEALTMMPVGSKWQVYIPQELGYGAQQSGMIPPYSTLIFDIELIGISK